MHDLLVNVEVHVCETMWTELSASGKTLRSERAVVRVDETSDRLKIYVPSDHDGLSSCYCTELAGELAKSLRIEDCSADKIIYRIINDQVRDLDTIMQDEDLHRYPWLPQPVIRARPMRPPFNGQSDAINLPGGATAEEDGGDHGPPMIVTQNTASQSQHSLSITYVESEPELDQVVSLQHPWQRVVRSEQYLRLLRSVISQGRRLRSGLQDAFSLSQLDSDLDKIIAHIDHHELTREFWPTRPDERAWIGAAGELFVRILDWSQRFQSTNI
jgi:hypothetical protein